MHAPASVCRMSDLGGELDALASGTGFSGVVRIDQSDRIELARAYGLAHRGFEIPNAVDTRFGIASGAKGFTALAVVSLIEDGVTVEHLLSHRSGIGDYLDEEAGFEVEEYVMPVPVHELATTEDYLAVLDGHASKFAPGERFAYCNAGYVVPAQSMRYGLGFWLHASTDAVILEGRDAGVSFRSVHDPRTQVTLTVISNTAGGAWPIARYLENAASS